MLKISSYSKCRKLCKFAQKHMCSSFSSKIANSTTFVFRYILAKCHTRTNILQNTFEQLLLVFEKSCRHNTLLETGLSSRLSIIMNTFNCLQHLSRPQKRIPSPSMKTINTLLLNSLHATGPFRSSRW